MCVSKHGVTFQRRSLSKRSAWRSASKLPYSITHIIIISVIFHSVSTVWCSENKSAIYERRTRENGENRRSDKQTEQNLTQSQRAEILVSAVEKLIVNAKCLWRLLDTSCQKWMSHTPRKSGKYVSIHSVAAVVVITVIVNSTSSWSESGK